VDGSERIAEQMALLRARFRERCLDRSRSLSRACDEADLLTIASLAHDITGSAGLFGFPALSSEAKALSNCCRSEDEQEAIAAGRALSASLLRVAAEGD
jgi:HPt (histidine-containing phosphotransfer) domain-containing protein